MAEEEITRAKKSDEKKTTAKKTSTSKKDSEKKTSAAKKTTTAKKTDAKKTAAKKKTTRKSTTLRLSKDEKELIKDFRECSDLSKTLIMAAVNKLAERASNKKEEPSEDLDISAILSMFKK